MSQKTQIAKPISKASKAIAQIQRKKNAEVQRKEQSKSNIHFLGSDKGGIQRQASPAKVQAKLKIGAPNDKYEVEADQMASEVMRMPESAVGQISGKSELTGTGEVSMAAVRRKCSDCKQEEEDAPGVQKKDLSHSVSLRNRIKTVQRVIKPSTNSVSRIKNKQNELKIQRYSDTDRGRGPPQDDFSSKLNQSKGSGQPLDSHTNSFMSSRFGADFSNVKVHTGNNAAQMSNDISAKAFTHQNHIYFNQGQYQPNTSEGKTLIAHELTHTIQQGAVGSGVQRALKIGSPNDPHEQEADAMANKVMRKCTARNDQDLQRATNFNSSLSPNGVKNIGAPLGVENISAPRGVKNISALSGVENISALSGVENISALSGVEVQLKSWEKEEQYNSYTENNSNIQRKCSSCSGEEIQPKLDNNPLRGPPLQRIGNDSTREIRRGFWDDPLGSIGGALSGAAQWVGDSLSAGVTWLKGELSEMARNMPGYSLLGVVIGQDPITGNTVERNGRNFIEAGLDVIPNGADYKRKLEEDGGMAEAAEWLDREMGLLDFSVTDVARDFRNFISTLALSDITSPTETLTRGINVFRTYVSRIITFARNVAVKLLEIVKEIAINALLTFLRDQTPWYPLITVVLGEDPVTGAEVERTGMNILRGFILLHPEGEAQLAQMEESGSLQRAADWIDNSILRVTRIISGLRNGFTTLWRTFSITNLLHPIDTFNQIYGLFNQPVSELIRFAVEVATMILEFIKEALIARLIEFARTIPGYHLVTVIMGKDIFSEEPIERSAINIIRGFMSLVPGGEEKFQEMQQTGAIQEALAWIEGAVAELNLTWPMVRGLFTTAWNSFSLADLATPIQTFRRVMDLFGAPLFRLVRFVGRVVIKLVEIALRIMGFPFELIGSIITRAQTAYELIKNDPVQFLKNILRAVKQAFVQFFGNILTHLINGVGEWLFGQLGDTGITIPTDFSFQSILGLIFQILGVTRERIFEKLREKVGPERWAQIEGVLNTLTGVWSFVSDVVTRGPIAIWEKVQEQLSGLWDMVLSAARNWIMTRIITQVTARLLSMLDPTGIMAVVNSFMVFFNAVQSAIQYMIPMLEMLNSFLGGVVQIAQGNIQPAADFLERTMARGMPILIGFLANQVGLGSIGSRIREVIESIQERVDRGIQWAIDRAWELGANLLQMGRNAVGAVVQWWRTRKSFTTDGEAHSLSFRGSERSAELMVASTPKTIQTWLSDRRTELTAANQFSGAKAAAHGRIQSTLLPELNTAKNPPANGNAQGRSVDQIMTDIVTAIQTIGMGASTARPPRVIGYGAMNGAGFGTRIIANPLTSVGERGTPAGRAANNATWNDLVLRMTKTSGGRSWYARGHLLNQRVGGLGNWSNLAPITQIANGQHRSRVEDRVKTAVNTRNKVLRYEVIADGTASLNNSLLGQIQNAPLPDELKNRKRKVVEAEQYVPLRFICRVTEYDDVGKWRSQDGISWTETIPTYDGSASTPADIKVRGEAALMNGWNSQNAASPASGTPQPKLKVGSPNDPLELQADQMADKVMRMPASVTGKQNHGIKRDTRFEARRKVAGSTKSTNNSFDSGVNATKGTGRPMDKGTQTFMESRFGVDFSGVNIHADSNAANLSDQIQAKAFTTGNDIYFNQGEYKPETTSGKKLLAHELTHTIQQGGIRDKTVQRDPKTSSTEQEKIIQIIITTARFGENTYGAEIEVITDKGKYPGYLYEASNLKVGGPYLVQHKQGETTDKEGSNDPEITKIVKEFRYQGMPFGNVDYSSFDSTEFELYIKGVDLPTNAIKLKQKSKEAESRAKRVKSGGFSEESKKSLLRGFDEAGASGKSKGDGTTGHDPSPEIEKGFEVSASETMDVAVKAQKLKEALDLSREELAALKALGERIPKEVEETFEKINFNDLPLLNEAFMLEGLLMGAGTKSDEIKAQTQQLLYNMSQIKGIIMDEIQDILIEFAAGAAVGAVLAFFTFGASLALSTARGAYLVYKLNKLRKLILKIRDAYNAYELIKNTVAKVGAISDSFKKFQQTYQDIKGKYEELKEKIEKAEDSTEEEDYLIALAKHELISAIQLELQPGGRLESILEMMLIPEDANLEEVLMNLPAGIKALTNMLDSYIPSRPPNLKYATGLMKKGFVAGKLLYPFVGFLTKLVNDKIEDIQNNSYAFELGDIFDGLMKGRSKRTPKVLPSTRKKNAKKKLDRVKTKKPEKPESVKKKEEEEAKKRPKTADKDPKKDEEKKTETEEEKKGNPKDDLWKKLTAELDRNFTDADFSKAVTNKKLSEGAVAATLRDPVYRPVRGKVTREDFKPTNLKIRFRVKRKDKLKVRYTKVFQNMYAFARVQPGFKHYFPPKDLYNLIMTEGKVGITKAKEMAVEWAAKRYRSNKILRVLSSASKEDPRRRFSFFLPGGLRDTPQRDRRFYYGFSDNVKQDDPDGLKVMLKGFTDDAWVETQKTQEYKKAVAIEKKPYTKAQLKSSKPLLMGLALFENARLINGMPGKVDHRFFTWKDAIMGHDDSKHVGAAGYWNVKGNKHARSENNTWNKDPANYWGPEHRKDSSASGSSAPDYDDPTRKSHFMWWDSTSPQWLGHKFSDYKMELS